MVVQSGETKVWKSSKIMVYRQNLKGETGSAVDGVHLWLAKGLHQSSEN